MGEAPSRGLVAKPVGLGYSCAWSWPDPWVNRTGHTGVGACSEMDAGLREDSRSRGSQVSPPHTDHATLMTCCPGPSWTVAASELRGHDLGPRAPQGLPLPPAWEGVAQPLGEAELLLAQQREASGRWGYIRERQRTRYTLQGPSPLPQAHLRAQLRLRPPAPSVQASKPSSPSLPGNSPQIHLEPLPSLLPVTP